MVVHVITITAFYFIFEFYFFQIGFHDLCFSSVHERQEALVKLNAKWTRQLEIWSLLVGNSLSHCTAKCNSCICLPNCAVIIIIVIIFLNWLCLSFTKENYRDPTVYKVILAWSFSPQKQVKENSLYPPVESSFS